MFMQVLLTNLQASVIFIFGTLRHSALPVIAAQCLNVRRNVSMYREGFLPHFLDEKNSKKSFSKIQKKLFKKLT